MEIELKKHSSLIAMSNKNISIPQRKLYNAILYLAGKQYQEIPDSDIFKIKFADIVKFSGYNDFSNLKYLKDCIRELVDVTIEYNILGKDKLNEWGVFSLLAQANIKQYSEHITVAFPPIIRDNLIYPNIYALLNLSIVNSLAGKYSLPLYELLTDYKKIRQFTIEISKLKTILSVNENIIFSKFRVNILDKSVAEINERSDLLIEYEPEKNESRSYTHIVFTIKDKYEKLSPVESSAYHLLKSKGLSESMAEKFAKQLSKTTIISSIEILEKAIKKGSIKNTVAYLTKILSNNISHEPDLPIVQVVQQNLFDNLENESVNFKKFIAHRIEEIYHTSTEDDILEFIANQNSFTIEHLIEKRLLDLEKNVVDRDGLLQNSIFKGWIQNKYLDYDLEKKNFVNIKG